MQPQGRRGRTAKKNNKLMNYVVDFVRVADCKDFDVNKLGDAFPHAEKLHSATEISFRCRMTKARFMKRLDKIVHHSIRIFEQDNQFFLREPLDKVLSSESSGPCQPAHPPPAPKATQQKKPRGKARQVHLVPAAPQRHRYWCGAAGGNERPEPFSACRPSAPRAPPKAPQRVLQSRPKAKVAKATAPPLHIELDEVSDEIALAPLRRRVGAEAPETQHARQVSNLLRSIAAVIAPRPTRAPAPIVIHTLSKSSEHA